MSADIKRLIAETEQWRSVHVSRRDQHGMSQRDREAAGIEALACAIRLKALQECLAIVEAG